MTNIQASGPGHVYDPRISRSRDFWFRLEEEGKKIRAARESAQGEQRAYYEKYRGSKLKPFNHEP